MEVAAFHGLDAALIDMEHTTFGLDVTEHLIVAAEAAGITPLVRPREVTVAEVGRVLDAGAQGIVFPRIDSRTGAEAAYATLFYPPKGVRGWGGSHTRAAGFAGTTAIPSLLETDPSRRGVYSTDYVDKSNDDVMSLFSIESVAAVEHLDDIVEGGRPTIVSFGWGDFSADVGFDLKACEEAYEHIYRTCREKGIGVALRNRDIEKYWYPGCYTTVAIDSLLVGSSLASAVDDARSRYSRTVGKPPSSV
jgi:2-keto-3-deoxy-L-rhamnonate aldolase RhmA